MRWCGEPGINLTNKVTVYAVLQIKIRTLWLRKSHYKCILFCDPIYGLLFSYTHSHCVVHRGRTIGLCSSLWKQRLSLGREHGCNNVAHHRRWAHDMMDRRWSPACSSPSGHGGSGDFGSDEASEGEEKAGEAYGCWRVAPERTSLAYYVLECLMAIYGIH
jgi:hypothetical protein